MGIWKRGCICSFFLFPGDGTLDKSELTYALDMCLQGSGLDVATTNSARLTDMLFKKAKGQTEDTNSLPEGNVVHRKVW